MYIIGQKVILRAIEETDIETLYQAINDPFLEMHENGFNFPIALYQQKEWIKENNNINTGVKLIIEYNGKAAGYTNILNIDWKNRTAWNGIKLFNEEYRGQGLGMDTVMAVMRFCFEEMNLNRLEGQILTFNIASYNLYIKRCGWKVEGTKRKCVFKQNDYHDAYMVAVLKEDYLDLITRTNYWNRVIR